MTITATVFAGLAALLAPQAAPDPSGWTWTLYADTRPVVLSNEIVDTPHLRTTLECDPGHGVVRVVVYGAGSTPGMARVGNGEAVAMTQIASGRGNHLRVAVPSDHPAFVGFVANGRLQITRGDQVSTVTVPSSDIAKLRRFAELCSR